MINPILKLDFRKNNDNVICALIAKQDINLADWAGDSTNWNLSGLEAIISKIRWMANPNFYLVPKYNSTDDYFVELSISSAGEILGEIMSLCAATDFVASAMIDTKRVSIAIGENVTDT